MIEIKIPQEVQLILNILTAQGYEAYVVGGCVRDSLLGQKPQDWDICTSALPQEVKKAFNNFPVLETGLKHGTVTVMIEHELYEVTTYRIEGKYSDNRHPDKVEFIKNLEQDLARRDFTINAMAYNPKSGLVDCFNGLADLRNKIIRCVGKAEERFLEDGLRILRALRFASAYDFKIDKNTEEAIEAKKGLLSKIAVERIQVELNKLLCGPGVKRVLHQFAEVLAVIIPEILPMLGFGQNNPHHIYDLWTHTIESVAQVPQQKVLRLTMLFHDLGKPDCYTVDKKGIGHYYGHSIISAEKAEDILQRLKYDRATINTVFTLVAKHDLDLLPQKKYLKPLLNKIGVENFRLLLEVQKADNKAKHPEAKIECLEKIREIEGLLEEIIRQEECFTLKDLAINGQDLLKLGIKQGPEVGTILNFLLQQVIEERVGNSKEELLLLARSFVKRE